MAIGPYHGRLMTETDRVPSRTTTCLILNPSAGSADAVKDRFEEWAAGRGGTFRFARREGDIRRFTREAIEERIDRIIAAGGDGTIAEVLNAMAPDFDRAELAVVPLGTANDLARSLDIPAADPAAALDLAMTGSAKPVDIVRVTGDEDRYFLNAASGGFGGEIGVRITSDDKRLWGAFAYWMAAAAELANLSEYHLQLTIDGAEVEADAYGLEIANGRFVGGGFPVARNAMLDDGLIEVTIIPVLPTFEILAAGIGLMRGQVSRQRLIHHRGARVELHAEPAMLFSMDGEHLGEVNATFEVLPRALRVVSGPNPPGLSGDVE